MFNHVDIDLPKLSRETIDGYVIIMYLMKMNYLN